MSFYVIINQHQNYWTGSMFGGAGDAYRFPSSTVAEREANILSENTCHTVKVQFIKTPETISMLPAPVPVITFNWLLDQASEHLRQADTKRPMTEHNLKSAITHTKFALAMFELALAKNQGELFT